MWYAAKETTYGGAFPDLVEDDNPMSSEIRFVFLRRSTPSVLIEVRKAGQSPYDGTVEFDSKAAALEAAKLISRPGRRVAVPVATVESAKGRRWLPIPAGKSRQ